VQASGRLEVGVGPDDDTADCAEGAAHAAAASSSGEMRRNARQAGSASSPAMGGQQMQLDWGDEGSGTEAAARPSRKRSAVDSLLKSSAQQRAGANSDSRMMAMVQLRQCRKARVRTAAWMRVAALQLMQPGVMASGTWPWMTGRTFVSSSVSSGWLCGHASPVTHISVPLTQPAASFWRHQAA